LFEYEFLFCSFSKKNAYKNAWNLIFCLMYLWMHENFNWIWKCMFECINLIFCYFLWMMHGIFDWIWKCMFECMKFEFLLFLWMMHETLWIWKCMFECMKFDFLLFLRMMHGTLWIFWMKNACLSAWNLFEYKFLTLKKAYKNVWNLVFFAWWIHEIFNWIWKCMFESMKFFNFCYYFFWRMHKVFDWIWIFSLHENACLNAWNLLECEFWIIFFLKMHMWMHETLLECEFFIFCSFF